MVNHQTSQYELLNLFFGASCLGAFQCVRDILQVTVLIDHPVESHRELQTKWFPKTLIYSMRGTSQSASESSLLLKKLPTVNKKF